jgi:hypothetical protein
MEPTKGKYATTPVPGSEGVYSRYWAGTAGHALTRPKAPSSEHAVESGRISEDVRMKESKRVVKK